MALVRLGIDRIVENWNLIPAKRWGLVTNYTGVTADLRLSSVALREAGAPLVALLSPEHGLRGTAQAGESDGASIDPDTGLPVLDTYLREGEALDSAIAELDLDALVVDFQDVGVRFYTYVWTMVDCMRSAARLGIPVYILDRPNPLGGQLVSGPGLLPDFASFVGRIDIPLRHGLTIGELARVAAQLNGPSIPDPVVVTMEGWHRDMWWEDTGLTWVMPSPNLPTPATATVYSGTALFEGTNLSEGRGTTRPFELVGAPWLDGRYASQLNSYELPGVRFREAWFQPTFSKFAGEVVGGVQVHVTDPLRYDPVTTGVRMLQAAVELEPEQFQVLGAGGQGVLANTGSTGQASKRVFLDLLWGSDSLRRAITENSFELPLSQAMQAKGGAQPESSLLY